jgi:GT2 family glycosyltransferase
MLEASVLIVNYRSEALVAELLDHLGGLAGERPARVVVVDNSPGNGLARRLRGHALEPKLVVAPGNLGFAGGVNLGLPHCREPVVVLVNPDARPEPGCLGGLVRALETDGCWVAGPALLPWEGSATELPSATRRDPGVLSALVEHTVLHRLFPRSWLDEHYFLRPAAAAGQGRAVPCAMVQGACMAVRRQAFAEVGPFDAGRFFLYWEETDFCRRIRAAGGTVLLCPDLRCRHTGGASQADHRASRQHFWRGFYAYHRKHGGRVRAAVLRVLLPPGMAAEWLILRLLDRARRGRDEVLRRDIAELRERLREQLRPLRAAAAVSAGGGAERAALQAAGRRPDRPGAAPPGGDRGAASMRVSLVTTVKNERSSAAGLIAAVKRLSRQPDEWIVVDGGSNDGTAGPFLAEPACRLVQAAGNIARGRNLAISRSTAPVIAVTDGGCRPAPDWLARLSEPIEAGRADIAAGATVPRVRRPLDAAQWALLDQFVLPGISRRRPAVSSRSLAFRREVWELAAYPEWLDHGEDTWAVREWLRRGLRLERVAGAVVEWDLRDSFRAVLAQHFRYMRGDGRARLNGRRHLARFAFYGGLAGLLVWGGGRASLAGAAAGLWLLYLAASALRLLPLLRGRGACFAVRSLAWSAPLLLGMDAAKMAGYVRGRFDPRPGPAP